MIFVSLEVTHIQNIPESKLREIVDQFSSYPLYTVQAPPKFTFLEISRAWSEGKEKTLEVVNAVKRLSKCGIGGTISVKTDVGAGLELNEFHQGEFHELGYRSGGSECHLELRAGEKDFEKEVVENFANAVAVFVNCCSIIKQSQQAIKVARNQNETSLVIQKLRNISLLAFYTLKTLPHLFKY